MIKPRETVSKQQKHKKPVFSPNKGLMCRDNHENYNDDIISLIQRRRLQLLVHSCIYYHFNDNLISDSTYDAWSKELVELQLQYSEQSEKAMWYDEFRDWDGSTGYHLPTRHPWVVSKAKHLLAHVRRRF